LTTWPACVVVVKGTKAPVVALSLGSAVSKFDVSKFCPVKVISLAGTSGTPGVVVYQRKSSPPTTPLLVALPVPKKNLLPSGLNAICVLGSPF
jgi:hypothetical protein